MRVSPQIVVPGVPDKLIIQGITRPGRAFRPSDWAERLCGVMSVFGPDEQLPYSEHVRPIMNEYDAQAQTVTPACAGVTVCVTGNTSVAVTRRTDSFTQFKRGP
jgi:hypothetical protein